ncbi:MAG: hypothetical protein ACO1RA_19060 [Planctomycetaceae bacterium]
MPGRLNLYRFNLCLGALTGLLVIVEGAQGQSPSRPTTPSSAITDDLLGDLPTTPPQTQNSPKVKSAEPAAPPTRQTPTGPAPSVEESRPQVIAGLLQKATEQLRSAQLTPELARVQQQILYQMDEWLAEEGSGSSGSKTSSGSSSETPEEGNTLGGEAKNPSSGKTKPSPSKEGNDPTAGTASSATPAGNNKVLTPAPFTPQAVAESFWGNLPPQERQRLQSKMPTKFLPQYRRQIEDYYRRLAEEGARK